MPLIAGSIPNLINGVSLQPAALRLASQAESVVNCMPSPVEGLKKRPPSYYIAKLFNGSAGSERPFTAIVDRDGTIRNIIIIQDNAIKAFDIDGTARTVSTPDGTGYLNITGRPSEVFRIASVADYTFIVNREKTVAMTAATSANWGTKSMVFIKTADYAVTYSITVNAITVTETTAASPTVPSNVTIATNLAASLNGNATFNASFVATASDYIVRITKNDGGAYTLSSTDNRNGEMTKAIKGTVDAISDLPTIAEHGFTVKIQGSKATGLDDYYVKFETTAGSGFGPGVWRETVAPGIVYEFDKATMPHVLIRDPATGNFSFEDFDWAERVAGDATTAPNPSFVGTTIQNINLFRNRLVLLADENVILSAADSFDRFWPETVQTVVDSDPIDISVGGTEINFLVASSAFANSLLLFSRHGQFRLDTGNVAAALTPKTANISSMTAFEMVATVDPVAIGRTLYFAVPKGVFTGIREFYLPDSSGPAPISEEITSAIPKYLPGDLCSFTATISEEMLILVSKSQPRRLYIYKFTYQDDTKLQSAWSYWEFSGDVKSIVGANVIDSNLYVYVEYANGVYLERIRLRANQTDDTTTAIELLLDRKVSEANCTATLTTPAGLAVQTTIEPPYPLQAGATYRVVGRYFTSNPLLYGQIPNVISTSLTGGTGGVGQIVVSGDLTLAGTRFYVGELYDMDYQFSTQYIMEQPAGGGMAVAAGPKLMLRTWTMVFDTTSAFNILITPQGRATQTYPYNAITPGDASYIGTLNSKSDRYRVPVMGENIKTIIKLTSSSPLPCRFQSAEWEGWYHSRATRL